jgi:LmbE family N-acetylglucosaminyl deacetylase
MDLLEKEGLEPHTVPEIYLMAMAQGDIVVDITDTLERKLAALHCHASQYDNWDDLAERIRGWAHLNAEQNGLGEGRAAESFLRVPAG